MNEESKRQRIAILNVLAGYYIRLAVKAKEGQRDQFYDLATTNYNKADKIDIRQEMTWVGKGSSFMMLRAQYVSVQSTHLTRVKRCFAAVPWPG